MYRERRARIASWLETEAIDAACTTADADVRYLTGMPGDSVLVIFRTGEAVLLPWDINLANLRAECDRIVPYTEYRRDLDTALEAVLAEAGIGAGGRVEVPATMSFPGVSSLQKKLDGIELVCRENGFATHIASMRSVKDDTERSTLRRAAEMTNRVIDELEEAIGARTLETELDVALFLESRARSLGGEGTGFEPIVAGPSRSNGIHAFPAFTAAPFSGPGLGIIDFGINVDGYTSDVTLTAVFGTPTPVQQQMLDLVLEAYDQSVEHAVAGADAGAIARDVDSLFEASGYSMPHSLGHGIGLEVHEAPWLRSKHVEPSPLKPGMVFTLEPGLYHPTEGGVRFENDVMLTDERQEIITSSRILRFPDLG